MDRILALLSRHRKLELAGDRDVVDPFRDAERCKSDIDPLPATINHRLRRKPRGSILAGDDPHPGVSRLPVLDPEHQSKRYTSKRAVLPVSELELDVKGNGPALSAARQNKRCGGETGETAIQDAVHDFAATINL